jgi:HTH-type transcriptional regulator / antitoxin HigA
MEAFVSESIDRIELSWLDLSSKIYIQNIKNEEAYDNAVMQLNRLLDAGAANENHPLANLVDVLATLIAEYDTLHYSLPCISPVEMLKFLMQQHNLKQSNLTEIGTQGVISEILNGKRNLNVQQIKKLAQRFQVSPSVFI